jgi:hypothetical protein
MTALWGIAGMEIKVKMTEKLSLPADKEAGWIGA